MSAISPQLETEKTVNSIIDGILKFRAQIAAAAAVLLVFCAAYFLYQNHRENVAQEAASALFEAGQEKGAAATKSLEKIAKDYPGTLAGYEAQMRLAEQQLNSGDVKVAITEYQKALDSAPSKPLKAFARYGRGYAHEKNHDYDSAVKDYQEALRFDFKSLKPELLLGLARVSQSKGDSAKALEYYNMIAAEFPGTPYAQFAQAQKSAK